MFFKIPSCMIFCFVFFFNNVAYFLVYYMIHIQKTSKVKSKMQNFNDFNLRKILLKLSSFVKVHPIYIDNT